jgi:hypothetical protein
VKALSIRSPWWWAILEAGKDIENRDWSTNFRGRFLIHVGKWFKEDEIMEDLDVIRRIRNLDEPAEDAAKQLKPYGGCIVGSVEIVDCVTESTSPWFFGKYGFVLRNPVTFDKPVPRKGALGFFEVEW